MIRQATSGDVRCIAEFAHDIRQDSVPSVHPVEGIEWYIVNILLPRGSSYVFEDEGEVLAWLDVEPGWVHQLYCRRGSTGRGVGRQLLKFAKSLSPKGLELWTFQVNDGARRFYAREGFVEVEWTDGAGNEEKQPDVRLEWRA